MCGGCCGNDREVEFASDTLKRESNSKLKGPLHDRKVRDIPMLIIFILFVAGMAGIAVRTSMTGNIDRLTHGTDSFGNICGQDNTQVTIGNSSQSNNTNLDMTAYTKVYYRDLTELDATLSMCVAACPNETIACRATAGNRAQCEGLGVCLNSGPYTYDPAFLNYRDNDDACPDSTYKTRDLIGINRCFPVDFGVSLNNTKLAILFNASYVQLGLADAWAGRYAIAYMSLASIAVGLLLIILMRCIVKPLVYLSVLLVLAGSAFLCWLSYDKWHSFKTETLPADKSLWLDVDVRNEKFLKILFIIVCVVTGIIWLLVIALRNRIRLAVTILQEASKALASIPALYFSPIFTTIVMLAFVGYWLFIMAYLSTVGTVSIVSGRAQTTKTEEATYMVWYHIFGFFWLSQFILACEEIVIAGSIASWYFTQGSSAGLLKMPYCSSIGRLVKYHMGSAAFGSLLIAIIQMIRFLFEYFTSQADKYKTNPIVEVLKYCVRCCLWCLEKMMRFLNKNAYIEIAIYGYSFCTAARQALMLIAEWLASITTLNLITAFVLFICKLLVVIVTGAISYFYITQIRADLLAQLNYYAVVIAIIGIVAYLLADLFLDVYDMAADTIFLCYAEDVKRNDGSPEKPYYMSTNLAEVMGKYRNEQEKKKAAEKKEDKEDKAEE
eukprot:m.353687 g.353687  ORF g.353687 m.353687 type:complete len:667 (-) comp16820_c0_seq1:211-2211(-)